VARRAPACLALACLLLWAAPALALRDVSDFAIQGVRLGMRVQEAEEATGLEAAPLLGPRERPTAWQIMTKQGFTGGGFFQVSFSLEGVGEAVGKDLGLRAYIVTLNRRTKAPRQDLEPLLAEYRERYGPWDRLCREDYGEYEEYRVWWGAAPACGDSGQNPDGRYMFLSLVSGTWTEVFLTLVDTELLRESIDYVRVRGLLHREKERAQ
jgi:hypothetical protein